MFKVELGYNFKCPRGQLEFGLVMGSSKVGGFLMDGIEEL
jgi:hypothetical protein